MHYGAQVKKILTNYLGVCMQEIDSDAAEFLRHFGKLKSFNRCNTHGYGCICY